MNPEGEQNYWRQGEERLAAHDSSATQTPQANSDESLVWQASEAVHHEKHFLWFAAVVVGAVIFLAISIFLIRSWTFSALVVVMAAAVIFLASRPPRVLQYRLSYDELQIGEKRFGLHDFRAFGVVHEGSLYSLVLIPSKRFMPAVNVYFPPENGERIVDVFGAVLPMEHIKLDFIDKLTRAVRF